MLAAKTTERVAKIDFASISKLAKALNIPPKQWDKIMRLPTSQKKEVELCKYILKKSLPEADNVSYRIREQKYGGFSITLSGELFIRFSQYHYNGIVSELNEFYSRTSRREEFASVYEEFISLCSSDNIRNTIGTLNYKDTGLYTRFIENSGYRAFNRYGSEDLLYDKLLNLIDFTKRAFKLSTKLIEYENAMNWEDITVDEEYTPIEEQDIENLISVPNDFIFNQLATLL